MALKRSNVEFAKRVFLDRLTADDAPSGHGPGVDYLYGGVYDPFNFGIGADCSGSAGIFIGAAFKGTDLSWSRQFSTETWRLADPHHGPFGGRRVGPRDWGDAPIRVCLTHGGGGPNSHMAVWIDGWMMESNGTYGTCTEGGGARSPDSPKWNDWCVIDEPIVEDTTFRQEQGYPRGLNYADGRPSGTVLKDAGVTFVVRHLSDGGTAQPQKRLTPEESNDLGANGIPIVSLWESYSNRMREGYQAGLADARAAQDWHLHCSGPDDAPIYFSCSYDEPESDQPGVNDYLRACCDVLGGPGRVGIYGAYYVCKRALDAGVARFMWQTESWSGGNIDARVNIMQRNKMGFEQVGGVQAAINEAHTDYFGQWAVSGSLPNPIPAVTGATTPAAPQVPVTPVTPVTPSAPEASPMTDTIYADVSEWQQPVDDSYPHRVICIRSNDGTHRDEKWATNYEWCKRRCDDGALDFFIVYFVWRPNWEQAVATHKDLVGEPHPRMVVMIDVETWGGQIRGDQSAGLTGAYSALVDWLGHPLRVIGYGNRGDLDELWPQKPDGLRLVMAAYGTNPSYPGKIAHQYTNGQGFGGGLPEGADPFGVCDMNSADGLHPHAFASACGITIAVEPAIPEPTVTEPTTVPTPAASGFTEQDRQLLTAVYDMLAKITGGPPRAVQSPNDSGPRGGPTKATKRSPAKSTKRSPAKAAKAAPAKATKRSPAAMAEGTP